jgi:predicted AAA+ superfamily ATPase
MKQYGRTIGPEIRKVLFKGKIIIIYGARQVGKTTLVQELQREYGSRSMYLNCDEPDIRAMLSGQTSTAMRRWIGSHTLVVIDEAQRVRNIGLSLKLLADNYPQIQVLATGSSSFELSNQVIEPLTGRKIEFHLYPLSVNELLTQENVLEFNRLLEHRMIYGTYPGVVTSDDPERLIREITTSYLYRDILEYQIVKNTEQLHRLLQALALQIGNEVSYNELSSLLGISKNTVERYVGLLEQGYIIFRLPPFSRNLRKELSKRRKIYFYDLGIRNALINNFNPLYLRQDTGHLWENFCIVERMKWNRNRQRHTNDYFWRTYQGDEVDYIEEAGGKLVGFEFKWRAKRWRQPTLFTKTYPNSELHLVNRENLLDFLA